jgi:hypothetical protein
MSTAIVCDEEIRCGGALSVLYLLFGSLACIPLGGKRRVDGGVSLPVMTKMLRVRLYDVYGDNILQVGVNKTWNFGEYCEQWSNGVDSSGFREGTPTIYTMVNPASSV